MTESMGEKPKTTLEITEQVLRDAGFVREWLNTWDRQLKQPEVGTYRVRVASDFCEAVTIVATKDLSQFLTAPAMVQTLVRACNAARYVLERHHEHWDKTADETMDFSQELALLTAALTAAEQANLPRLYSMKEILQQMDGVISEPAETGCKWTETGKATVELAFQILEERLQGPQKGGAKHE